MNIDVIEKILDKLELNGIHIQDIKNSLDMIMPEIDIINDFIFAVQNADYKSIVTELILHFKEIILSNDNNHNFFMSTFLVCICSFVAYISSPSDFKPDIKYINISISSVLISVFLTVYSYILNTLSNLFSFMKACLPVYIGLSMISKANNAIYSILIFLITGFQYLSTYIFMPLIMYSAVVSSINIMGDLSFLKVHKTTISSINWIVGLYTALHLSFVKLLNIVINPANKVVHSGFKYIITKGIPIVGGYTADSLNEIVYGLFNLNSLLGGFVSCSVVLVSIIPIILIIFICITLKIFGGLLSLFSDSSTTEIVDIIGKSTCELGIIFVLCSIGFVSSFSWFDF